jgi:hypothetical protein
MATKKSQLKVQAFALSSLMLLNFQASAASKKSFAFKDNSNVPAQNIPAPSEKELGFLEDKDVVALAENFKTESKRRPAGTALVATEDMLSKDYVEFRNKIIHANTGVEFNDIIKSYDAKYDQIPASANDLKYTVARMAAWLPMKGIIWRMTPMVHQVATTQQALLASLKNVAEQVKINEPGSHVEAHMLYLSMPSAELVGRQFHYESDFIAFLANEVYPSLKKSVQRIEALKMANVQKNGEETPIVFDSKIRFGETAFNGNYDDYDRFKVEGEAERFATLSRIQRRMYNIATMVSYNWNGHLALKREIGKMYGVGVVESALFDALPGEDNVYLKGVSRAQRVAAIRNHPALYTLTPNGKGWMALAYYHLHKSGLYLEETWKNIKNNDGHYIAQIDPDVFMARKEQVEAGMMNIKKLTGAYGAGVNGKAKINGALSGDELVVDLKGFYENPPRDLKNLLPIAFAGNEDITALKKMPQFASMTELKAGSDVLSMNLAGKKVSFRNYLHGRATAWNASPEGYGRLFPNLKRGSDVGAAMRILNETRGTRILTNGLTLFVR